MDYKFISLYLSLKTEFFQIDKFLYFYFYFYFSNINSFL